MGGLAATNPVEAHILSGGQHGFNMGQRAKLRAVNTWPQRLADWLADRGLLEPRGGDGRAALYYSICRVLPILS